jgi:hypothetical protein
MGKKLVELLWSTQQRKTWTIILGGLFVASLLIRFISPDSSRHMLPSQESLLLLAPNGLPTLS